MPLEPSFTFETKQYFERSYKGFEGKLILKGGSHMGTFFMFGRYSLEALKGMRPKRTKEGEDLIKKYGGKVEAMYALLGEKDVVLILNFPGIEQAMKASVALTKTTGISFTTLPAVPVEEFDKLMSDV